MRATGRATGDEARCPACGERLLLRRIEDLNVVEYRARCRSCGWAAPLRGLLCGGCHGPRFFMWTGEEWRCLNCGRTRSSSPPRPDQDRGFTQG